MDKETKTFLEILISQTKRDNRDIKDLLQGIGLLILFECILTVALIAVSVL